MPVQKLHTDQVRQLLQQSTRPELPDVAGVESPELLPDAVLPEQFDGSPHGTARTQSEIALMRAVLDDALNCYQKQFLTTKRREQRLATEAAAWVFSDDDRWPFSFVNVCHALGLEPEYLRRGHRRWHQRPPAVASRKQRRTGPGRRIMIAA